MWPVRRTIPTVSRPKNDEPDAFALAIAREIRKELGARRMSGRALARELQRSEKYIRDRINDTFEFSLNDVEAFAHLIGVRPEDFVARVDSPDIDPIAITADEGVKSAFDLAAQKGERRADQPHAE
jgi:hypothetical protein